MEIKIKIIKRTATIFLLVALLAVASMGCSKEKTDGASECRVDDYKDQGGYNVAYILNETDFAGLKKDLEAGRSVKKWQGKYTSMTELNVGETYYAVGYTVAETRTEAPFSLKEVADLPSWMKRAERCTLVPFTKGTWISVAVFQR